MKTIPAVAVAASAVAMLAGCVVQAPSQPAPAKPASSQPAPPAVGFAAEVTNAAVENCRRALDTQTDGAVEVTGTESSQANDAVYMVVGANRAPWMCLVSRNGAVQELRFIGSDGAL
ncbi:hypothetical protein [Rubrimonas cliftonensis]|uniref:Lipoprotein n=1 Tax=Rubrimonas cliftonensis TaxID=89524 RepID=A0A1H4FR55_9RHOB|nr:hypothetical protein [Rubrimonas cliftonensis]SEA99290.1 hypothetical protein SAMN05444370_12627 [Rubrimonas cliftonensis]